MILLLSLHGGAVRAFDPFSLGLPSFSLYGERDGLPGTTVYNVRQDGQGRLWVATQNGLAVFDGHTWRTTALPIPAYRQVFRAVEITPDGSLWVGTQTVGLWRLQKGQWSQQADLGNRRVNGLCVLTEPGGGWSLWAATDQGIGRYDGQGWRRFTTAEGLPHDFVWKIHTGLAGRVLAATKSGLVIFQGGKMTVLTQRDGLPSAEVNDVLEYEDHDGSRALWVCCWGVGLARWQQDRFVALPEATGFISRFPICLAVVRRPGGERMLWVGTNDQGLNFRRQDGSWCSLSRHDGLPSMGVYTLYTPPGGRPNLWVGYRGGGLAALNLDGFFTFDQRSGLPSPLISAILETRDSRNEPCLWFGSSQLGVSRLSRDGWQHYSTAQGLPSNEVLSLAESAAVDGRTCMVAGTTRGLAVLRQDYWFPLFETVLGDVPVRALLPVQMPDGTPKLWVGTEKGVFLCQMGKLSSADPSGNAPAKPVWALAERPLPGGGGELWVGTDGGGVNRCKDGEWTGWGLADGLPSLSIRCLRILRLSAGRDVVFVGTFGGGLAFLPLDAPRRWQAVNPRTLPAFPAEVVRRIELDRRGNLYLNTNDGVIRLGLGAQTPLDPRTWSIHTYSREDGLPSRYPLGSSLTDSRGRLWFGTSLGIGVLDPEMEQGPAPMPALYWEQIQVAGQNVGKPSALDLAYDQSPILVECVLPTFYRAGEVRYQSQLIGLEASPLPWTREGRRELTFLPPGNYTLRIQARDHLGRLSEPLQLPIRVRPSPWWSTWAILAYGLAIAGLVLGLYRFKLRKLRQRARLLEERVRIATMDIHQKQLTQAALNKRLQQLNEEKNRLLGVAAHDIKNMICALSLSCELLEATRNQDEMPAIVADMNRTLGNMQKLIHNLLDVAAIEAGAHRVQARNLDLDDLVTNVIHTYASQAEKKDMLLVYNSPGEAVEVLADEIQLKEVLENLVSNAIKYTPPGPPSRTITLQLSRNSAEGMAVLDVKDQGPGFSEEDRAHLFGRFMRLSAKPTGAEHSTGLGLAITKEMVEGMGGRIDLLSSPGESAHFRVRVPLAKGPVET